VIGVRYPTTIDVVRSRVQLRCLRMAYVFLRRRVGPVATGSVAASSRSCGWLATRLWSTALRRSRLACTKLRKLDLRDCNLLDLGAQVEDLQLATPIVVGLVHELQHAAF
jgi:hypothetical protein